MLWKVDDAYAAGDMPIAHFYGSISAGTVREWSNCSIIASLDRKNLWRLGRNGCFYSVCGEKFLLSLLIFSQLCPDEEA
jgi:hypothetical protein